MKKACYPLQDIARVTRQKNIERLKAYLEKPAFEEKENYADDLFKSQATTVTLSDFEPLPKKSKTKKSKPRLSTRLCEKKGFFKRFDFQKKGFCNKKKGFPCQWIAF